LDMEQSPECSRPDEGDAKLKYVLHGEEGIAFPHWQDVRLFPHVRAGFAFEMPTLARQGSGSAYVIHTSGTTGRPKGAIGTHKGVVNRLAWARRALQLRDDEVYCLNARTTAAVHVADMFQSLLTGRPLFVVGDDVLQEMDAFIVRLCEWRITRLSATPALLQRLVSHPNCALLDGLRSVICHGGTLTVALARRVAHSLPGVRLFHAYGVAEAGAECSFYEVARESGGDLAGFFQAPGYGMAQVPDTAAASHTTPHAGHEHITCPGVALGDIKKEFVASLFPENALSVDEYRLWFKENILPFVVNVSSGKFIGHMTSALPDFMCEISALIAQLNQNMVKIETSKALTFLERQLLATLHREFYADANYDDRIQNPDHVFGLVVSGGSSANISAMWNARNRALLGLGFDKADIGHYGAFELLRQKGYRGFAIVASGLAHYSMRKAASLLGIGERNLLVVKQDARQKADLADLESKLTYCRDQGILVVAIVGIAGATETGTIDPIADMAAIAAREKIHFHVDAAWGGAIVFSDKYKHLLNGIEHADSITLCPHKQLYAPQGISVCLFKDSRSIHASSVQAVYQGKQGSFDMGQYTIEGSRPAIFLSLHALFHIMPRTSIGALIDLGIEKARHFAELIAGYAAFEIVGSPEINIVNYRYIPRDLRKKRHFSLEENRRISKATSAIQERQFLDGKTFVSKTDVLNGNDSPEKMTVFRVVIANPLTTHRDLIETIENQLEIADALVEDPRSDPGAGQVPAFRASLRAGPQVADLPNVPIGRAAANAEILILDGERRKVPAGSIGEIYIGGEGLAMGYVSPDDTPQVFVPHPFKPGAVLVKTGDYGLRLADGNLYHCGRHDAHTEAHATKADIEEADTRA
jgi:putative pyridoxal-dependent aspartate 1-decarboxylase